MPFQFDYLLRDGEMTNISFVRSLRLTCTYVFYDVFNTFSMDITSNVNKLLMKGNGENNRGKF